MILTVVSVTHTHACMHARTHAQTPHLKPNHDFNIKTSIVQVLDIKSMYENSTFIQNNDADFILTWRKLRTDASTPTAPLADNCSDSVDNRFVNANTLW